MTRSLQEKLAALQRSVAKTPIESPEETASPQTNQRRDATLEDANLPGSPVEYSPQPTELGLTALGFEQCDDGRGPHWKRTIRYDLLTLHGSARFADLLSCDLGGLFKALKQDPDRCDPMRFRFYDTETTGLGTGAGTFPFLHAVGQIEQDDFVVYQYFLHVYGQETALLHALTERHFSDPFVSVVSFNGKSFDWPLLRSRLVMQRVAIREDVAQIDLLYPSRRLWKSSLTSVSLGELERNVLGLQRMDDLPGKEAPNRYFAYADNFDPSLVEPVFAHNATDVGTLVTLLVHISEIISGNREVFSSGAYVALARWYDEWAEHDFAERCFTAAVECGDADWKAHWLQSLYYKRRGQWEQALEVWRFMHERFGWSIQPAVELAKYAEHRIRDYVQAEQWTTSALLRAGQAARLESRSRLQALNGYRPISAEAGEDQVVQLLRRRLERISGKRQRSETSISLNHEREQT